MILQIAPKVLTKALLTVMGVALALPLYAQTSAELECTATINRKKAVILFRVQETVQAEGSLISLVQWSDDQVVSVTEAGEFDWLAASLENESALESFHFEDQGELTTFRGYTMADSVQFLISRKPTDGIYEGKYLYEDNGSGAGNSKRSIKCRLLTR